MHEIDETKLTDQTKFRLYEIKKNDNCVVNDINQQKVYSKKLSRCVTIFDYADKILIVLSAATSGVSIISFTSTTIGESVGIVSASFTLIFSLTTGINNKLLNMTINKKKKHDQLLMLTESKFNSIETLISRALGDLDISHEVIMILKEKDKYENMKYNLISENEDEKQEIVKISSIK